MSATVAMLHTSFVFVTVEPMIKDLFREILPDVRLIDFVDSDVLASVQREGAVSASSVRRMCHLARAAEDAGADVIFSACSSLGPAIDVARRLVGVPIVKIDDAMTRDAVERATRIGVLATVPTTIGPTVALIEEQGRTIGKDIAVTQRLCQGAFKILMAGERDRHDQMVSDGARDLSQEVDLVVLAQASMARLAPRLSEETGKIVLSSPRSGIEEVRRVLASFAGVEAAPSSPVAAA